MIAKARQKTVISYATEADVPALRKLLAETIMPGAIRFYETKGEAFFDAFGNEGETNLIFCVKQGSCCIGMAVASLRKVYLKGEVQEIAYLSHLRFCKEHRSLKVLQNLYAFIENELLRLHPEIELFITSIMRSNDVAKTVLTSARAGLPTYHHQTFYTTYLIPTILPAQKSNARRAKATDIPKLIAYWKQQGQIKDLFPAIEQELLPAVKDTLIYEESGSIIGTLVLWDQSHAKQIRIAAYPKKLMPFTKLLPSYFPPLNAPLACTFSSLFVFPKNRPDLGKALLRKAIIECKSRKQRYLIAGGCSGDGIHAIMKRTLSIKLDSDIYEVIPKTKQVKSYKIHNPFIDIGTL